MPPPRILIVDDQRDITRMLRIAVEALGRGYVVVDVPSAEEALLEVRRAPVDVLVTDLRLPGITGLELIKRLRNLASKSVMIVISAHADEITQGECRRLGAIFFPKPLSLDAFLAAIQQAVGERARAAALPAAADGPGISDRLARLRRDLGAAAVFLIDLDGQITVRAGDVSRLDMDTVLTPLMSAFSASLKVSRALGALVPANVHFFDGDAHDVYVANVGQQFALAIIFTGERGALQMGPVLRYGRQCADDLLNSIQRLGVPPAPGVEPQPAPPASPVVTAPLIPGLKTAPLGGPPVRKRTSPFAKKKATGSLANKQVPPPAVTAVLTPSASAPSPAAAPPSPPPPPLTPEELKALDDAAAKVTADAAASFWDAVGDGELGEVRSDTLSWEQAEKLGLLPPKK
jgi:DNA-binding response OmpR family regulator